MHSSLPCFLSNRRHVRWCRNLFRVRSSRASVVRGVWESSVQTSPRLTQTRTWIALSAVRILHLSALGQSRTWSALGQGRTSALQDLLQEETSPRSPSERHISFSSDRVHLHHAPLLRRQISVPSFSALSPARKSSSCTLVPMLVVPSMLVARFGRQEREPFQLATPSEVCNQPAAPLVVPFQPVALSEVLH